MVSSSSIGLHRLIPMVLKRSQQDPYIMELDDPPTEDEVREAIGELQCSKSTGPDVIPPEVGKAGGQTLIQKFTKFLCTCGEDGSPSPQI